MIGSAFVRLLFDLTSAKIVAAAKKSKINNFPEEITGARICAENVGEVYELLNRYKPDLVINCIGFSNPRVWNVVGEALFKVPRNVALEISEYVSTRPQTCVVEISSSEVNSESKNGNEDAKQSLRAMYRRGKLASERILLQSVERLAIIQPHNVYSKFELDPNLLGFLYDAATSDRCFKIVGLGKQKRYFIHAEDLANTVINLIEHDFTGTIEIANPEECFSVRELVSMFHDASIKVGFNGVDCVHIAATHPELESRPFKLSQKLNEFWAIHGRQFSHSLKNEVFSQMSNASNLK